MATLREIKQHISGVTATQKITKAMKMVAASKLRKAQEMIIEARPYAAKLDILLKRVVNHTKRDVHPLLTERKPNNIALAVITSDRGLCGSFNSNVIRRTIDYMEANKDLNINFILLGRRGRDFLKKRYADNVIAEKVNFIADINFNDVEEVARIIINQFLEKKLDCIYIIFNEFKSASQQRLIVRQLLPIISSPILSDMSDSISPAKSNAVDSETELDREYLYEPDDKAVLDELIPRHLQIQLWRIFLESFAAEMGARMIAMDNATENATEMIQELTLQFNKARQQQITGELLDIVGGSAGRE